MDGINAGAGSWSEHFSKSRQRKFWSNDLTGETTWTDPRGSSISSVGGASSLSSVHASGGINSSRSGGGGGANFNSSSRSSFSSSSSSSSSSSEHQAPISSSLSVLDLFPHIAGAQEQLAREGSSRSDAPPQIILDAANIGWCHGQNSRFSVDGIIKALGYFENLSLEHNINFAVTAFIPSSYFRKKPKDGSKGNGLMVTEDIEKIQLLVDTGKLTVVPAGDHDDRYLLNYTFKVGGYIVSNDLFKDHIIDDTSDENDKSLARGGSGGGTIIYRSWLQGHRVGFTFLRHETFMINPDFERFFVDALAGNLRSPDVNLGFEMVGNASSSMTWQDEEDEDISSVSDLPNSGGGQLQDGQEGLELLMPTLNLDIDSVELRSQIYANFPHILSISNAISAAFTSEKANELKYLLMARAHSLRDLGFYALAYNDLETILTKLDGNMTDAIQLFHLVNSHLT